MKYFKSLLFLFCLCCFNILFNQFNQLKADIYHCTTNLNLKDIYNNEKYSPSGTNKKISEITQDFLQQSRNEFKNQKLLLRNKKSQPINNHSDQSYEYIKTIRNFTNNKIDSSELIKNHLFYRHKEYIEFLKKNSSYDYERHILDLERECRGDKRNYKKVPWDSGKNGFRNWILNEEAPRINNQNQNYNQQAKRDNKNNKQFIDSLIDKYQQENLKSPAKVDNSIDTLENQLSKLYEDPFISNEDVQFAKLGLKFIQEAKLAQTNGLNENLNQYIYRAESICLTIKNPSQKEKHYSLSQKSHSDLSNLKIPPEQFEKFNGNQIQQCLVEELVETINNIAALRSGFKAEKPIENISTLIYQSSNIAYKHGEKNELEKGFAISSFCACVLKVGEKYTVLLSKSIDVTSGNATFRNSLDFLTNLVYEDCILDGIKEYAPQTILASLPPIAYKNLTLEYLDELEKASISLSKVVILNCNNLTDFKNQILPLIETEEERYEEAASKNIQIVAKNIFGGNQSAIENIQKISKKEMGFANKTGLNTQKVLSPDKEIFCGAARIFKEKSDFFEQQRQEELASQEKENDILEERRKDWFVQEELNFTNIGQELEKAAYSENLSDYEKSISKLGLEFIDKARNAFENSSFEEYAENQIDKKRAEAIFKTVTLPDGQIQQTVTYKLSDKAITLLQKANINTQNFSEFTGDHVQRYLHYEIVKTVNETSDLLERHQDIFQIKGISTLIYHVANKAISCNQDKKIEQGFALSDFCSCMLDLGKRFTIRVGRGVIKGLNGVSETGHNLIDKAADFIGDPIETTEDFLCYINDGVEKVAKCLGRNLLLAIEDSHEFYLNQNSLANAISQRTSEAVKTFLSQPPGEILEQSVAFFIEFFVTGQAFNAVAIKIAESLKVAKELGQLFKAEMTRAATAALKSEKAKIVFMPVTSFVEKGIKTAVKSTKKAAIIIEETFNGAKSSASGIKNMGLDQRLSNSKSKNPVNMHAHNVNTQVAINKKMSALQKAQRRAVKTKNLPDGRVRYYTKEKLSKNPGLTRSASHVTEFNPVTGQVRSWHECYDQTGNINRIHPKSIDGQDITGQHYPPTKTELELFFKKSRGPK